MDIEKEIAQLAQKTAATTKALRQSNFERDLPFLIVSDQLPAGQAYHEYRDGRIEVRALKIAGEEMETEVIRTLTKEEADAVRANNGIS